MVLLMGLDNLYSHLVLTNNHINIEQTEYRPTNGS